MCRRSRRLVAIVVSSSLSASCAIPLAGPRASASSVVTPSVEAKRPANEVLLTLRGEQPVRGKLIGIDGEEVTFLPAPYWSVGTRRFPVGEIVTLQVTDRKRALGRAAGGSFTAGFVLIGGICGASAKYDEDYSDCLAVAGILGAAAGLVGLVIGAAVDMSHPGTYHFDQMKPATQRKAVQGLVAR